MDSTTLIAIAVIFVVMASASVSAVAMWWSTTGPTGPYAGLPTSAPTLRNAPFQSYASNIFETQSNCWAYNNWMRVTVMNLFVALDASVTLGVTSQQQSRAAFTTFLQGVSNTASQISACPWDAWVQSATTQKRTPVSTIYTNIPVLMAKYQGIATLLKSP